MIDEIYYSNFQVLLFLLVHLRCDGHLHHRDCDSHLPFSLKIYDGRLQAFFVVLQLVPNRRILITVALYIQIRWLAGISLNYKVLLS